MRCLRIDPCRRRFAGRRYPTPDHDNPAGSESSNVFAPPRLAFFCASKPRMSNAIRASRMAPTTAKPAITPPDRPSLLFVVWVSLEKACITCDETHSPKVHPERARPLCPKSEFSVACLKLQLVPLAEQSMSRVPPKPLMISVRSSGFEQKAAPDRQVHFKLLQDQFISLEAVSLVCVHESAPQ